MPIGNLWGVSVLQIRLQNTSLDLHLNLSLVINANASFKMCFPAIPWWSGG